MSDTREKGPVAGEPNVVTVSREFDFPRASVFTLLTDPKKGAVSWSPEDAVNVLFELEPRPGGAIRIHDRDSEGNVHKTSGTVVDIVVPELLVVRTATAPANGAAPWEALQTVRFEELGPRRTRVTVRVKVLATGSFPGDAAALEAGFQGGWGEVLEKLRKALR